MGNILLLEFLFSHSKDSDANIGIIAILVLFEKNSYGFKAQGGQLDHFPRHDIR